MSTIKKQRFCALTAIPNSLRMTLLRQLGYGVRQLMYDAKKLEYYCLWSYIADQKPDIARQVISAAPYLED